MSRFLPEEQDFLVWFRHRADQEAGQPELAHVGEERAAGWTETAGRLALTMVPGEGHALLRVEGVIDDRSLEPFARALARAGREAGPHLFVDLALARPSTAEWVSAVNEAREPIESAGGRVVLVALSAMVRSHLELLGLEDLFAIASSTAEAESIAG